MSRNINPKSSVAIAQEESALRRTDAGKLLFTAYQGRNCALWFQDNRLVEASFFPQDPSKIGAIYIGKVKNVMRNIDACFVEITDGEICFLPFESAKVPYLLNRAFDGRILEGDEVLVQVTRDAQKTKQAALTAQISVSNDYFVMAMGPVRAAHSTKLSSGSKKAVKKLLSEKKITENNCLVQDYRAFLSPEQIKRLKEEGIALEVLSLPPTGIVVRTRAGEQESSEELLEQFHAVAEQYIRILYLAMHRSCFSCMKPAPKPFEDIVKRFTENAGTGFKPKCGPDENIDHGEIHGHKENGKQKANPVQKEIVTDQEAMYETLRDYCEKQGCTLPVRLYRDEMVSLAELYSVRRRMDEALESRVWLKSGAYLVIEPTEALTVIDVNSGKNETGRNAWETYRRINAEAAREVAFQLRLRNLSGIILVDFINMQSEKDEKELLAYLSRLVAADSVLTNVVDITPLGLVEITRKKISRPLREQCEKNF